MRQWDDDKGETWTIDIHVGAIKRVRAATEVDLAAALEGKVLERLAEDVALFVDILWVLSADQAEKKDPPCTEEDFASHLRGDAIDRATEAFLQELVDFFPQRRRKSLRKILEKRDLLEEKLLSLAETKMDDPRILGIVDRASQEIDLEMDRLLQGSGAKSGEAPGSSG